MTTTGETRDMFCIAQNGIFWDVIGHGPTIVARCHTKADAMELIDTWMSPKDVAEKWDVSESKLQKMRTAGDGPRHSKFGNEVRYRKADVLMYLAQRERRGTSCR